MRELSLFTGAGGGLLGTHLLGWRPVGYVEIDDYCQRVIAARIRDGILPDAPIFGNVNSFLGEGYARSYTGMVDVVTAGFPCQPFSLAGNRLGADDPRNGWPATIECIRVVRPRFALLENVPGLLTSGYFGTILGDLAESGFDCRWRVLSAAEMGAPHKRDRLWIAAYARSSQRRPTTQLGQSDAGRQHALPPERQQSADGFANLRENVADAQGGRQPQQPSGFNRRERQRQETKRFSSGTSGGSQHGYFAAGTDDDRRITAEVSGNADAERQGLAQRQGSPGERAQPAATRGSWWAIEPDVGRVANGVAARVDRLKALGNGQVPAVVRAAWMLLRETD